MEHFYSSSTQNNKHHILLPSTGPQMFWTRPKSELHLALDQNDLVGPK